MEAAGHTEIAPFYRLVPDATPGIDGVQAYWGVEDAEAQLVRLIELGARLHEPVTDVGGGIKTASVRDPFGNVFGIIENPHFEPAEENKTSD